MQCDAAMHCIIFIPFLEMPIHISIYQTKNNSLIAHQCLVMAFGIRNSLLVLASVGHFPEHAARFPVFINLLLDCFNPIIRNIHGHTVIKPISTILNRCCQPGHTRNFFRNGNRFGIYLMNQLVGQCQITNRIIILIPVKVIPIITERLSQAVAIIQHRCHTVKTKTVKTELIHPILTIGQQEMNHLILTIIKA